MSYGLNDKICNNYYSDNTLVNKGFSIYHFGLNTLWVERELLYKIP